MLLAGHCCAHVTRFYTLIESLPNNEEIRHKAKRSILHFIQQQQQKYNVFTRGRYSDHIYTQKDGVYCIIFTVFTTFY